MKYESVIVAALLAGCGGTETAEYAVCSVPPTPEPIEVIQEVVVEKEVIKTVEVPVVTEKIKKVSIPLQYVTNVCRRDVVKTGPHHYAVVSDRLVRLTTDFQELNRDCKAKVVKGVIKVREI